MNEYYKKHLARKGFEINEKIGSGLSGGTYKALQPSLNRYVAIKFFDNSFSKNDSDLRKRFIRESRLLSELQHPSIPYVLTQGEVASDGDCIPYMVMQYISGISLESYLKSNGKLDLDSALHIAFQLLDALDFVHKNDIVHRDVKPSNIMMLSSGHCFLIDFSIGFKLDSVPGMTRSTRTGDHLGSANYMSPEQSSNMKDVDGRSDLYSVTKVICEMLTGKPDINELSGKEMKLNLAIRKVFTKGAAFSRDERYVSASDYLRELKQASSTTSQFMDMPSKAACISTVCPSANWSSRGYYRGPNFIEDCTDAFCTSCGSSLLYKCPGCGHPIDNTRFCGGCGTEQFVVPECESCGSLLEKGDMGKNTAELGCGKCRRKAVSRKTQTAASNFDGFDDDIPF